MHQDHVIKFCGVLCISKAYATSDFTVFQRQGVALSKLCIFDREKANN